MQTSDIPKLIKCVSKECRCDCGGQAMIDGSGSVRLPIGFGFAPGSSRFEVSCVEYRGWMGQCLSCDKRILFWKRKKLVRTYPKSINRKLAMAQAA